MRITLLCAFLALLSHSLMGQTVEPFVVGSAGGAGAFSTNTLAWTSGEAVIETAVGNNAVVTQGFHQPKVVVTALEPPQAKISCEVWPNPTTEAVWVEVSEDQLSTEPFQVELIDLHGKALKKHSLPAGQKVEIPLQEYATGTYILRIKTPSGTFLQSFQISKIH